MRRLALSLALVSAAATPVWADPTPTTPVTIQSGKVCMDTLGTRHPPSCRTTIASRLIVDPNICVCPAGLAEAPAPFCGPNEAPAPDSKEADRARLAAFTATGTLVGASFQGRRFCVTRGRTGEAR